MRRNEKRKVAVIVEAAAAVVAAAAATVEGEEEARPWWAEHWAVFAVKGERRKHLFAAVERERSGTRDCSLDCS